MGRGAQGQTDPGCEYSLNTDSALGSLQKGQQESPHAPARLWASKLPLRSGRCGGKVGGLKTLNYINRNRAGNPIPAPSTKVKSRSQCSRLTNPHHQRFETSALRDARPFGYGLERTAELARRPAFPPGVASWGTGRGGAQGRPVRALPKDRQETGAESLFRFLT